MGPRDPRVMASCLAFWATHEAIIMASCLALWQHTKPERNAKWGRERRAFLHAFGSSRAVAAYVRRKVSTFTFTYLENGPAFGRHISSGWPN